MIKYPILQNKEWLVEQIRLKSFRKLAVDVGCSYGAIITAVRRFGLEVPPDAIRQKKPTVDNIRNMQRALRAKYPNGRFGSDASNWRGGRRTGGYNQCYIIIYAPEHPFATATGYILEHRLLMEKKLGRYLKPTEYVHHINGNKKDNRIENLELMASKKEHAQKHFDAVKEVDRLKRILDEHKISY